MTVNDLVAKLTKCNPNSEVFIQLPLNSPQYASVLDAYPCVVGVDTKYGVNAINLYTLIVTAISNYQPTQTPTPATELEYKLTLPTETERDKLWQQFLGVQDIDFTVIIKPWFELSWSMYHDLDALENVIEKTDIKLLPGSDSPHLLNMLLDAYLRDSELDCLIQETDEYITFCHCAEDLHADGKKLETKYSKFCYMSYLSDRWEEHKFKCPT